MYILCDVLEMTSLIVYNLYSGISKNVLFVSINSEKETRRPTEWSDVGIIS